jgi:hypothetical protein
VDVSGIHLALQVLNELTHEQGTIPSLQRNFAVVHEGDIGMLADPGGWHFGLQDFH